MSENLWPVAEPQNKRFKIFISGPPGCFKTRVMLGLANNGNRKDPALAVIDTELGTKHYAGDFAFRRLEENDAGIIQTKTKQLVTNPGAIKTLGMDTFSVYYEALIDEWVDKFLDRELTSKGHKGEYYTLQPRDYVHINRDAHKLVRMMLKCDLNIVCICQIKDKWENMKVVGSVFDGWKRLPYYFDTIIEITENKEQGGWRAVVKGKDRSNCLKPDSEIPWKNDKEIVKYLKKKFKQDLASGPDAAAYDPDSDKKETSSTPTTSETSEKPAEPEKDSKPAEEKPAEPKTGKFADQPKEEAKPHKSDNNKDESGVLTRAKLEEIVKAKKSARINDPEAWKKLVGKYNKVNDDGTVSDIPLTTAKHMTINQADELLRDIVRIEENPS